MNKQNPFKKNGAIFLYLLLVTVVFCLRASCFSPMNSLIGGTDAAMFYMCGKAWYHGFIPYIDFVDVKGPLLFFIFLTGQLITPDNTDGIFILQCISISLTLLGLYQGRGDKKLVYCTEVMKSLPEYPEFEGERYVGLSYKYMLADLQKPLLTLNEVLVHVEYQANGSSNTMWQQYALHPQGFAFLRRETMKHHPYFKERFKAAIHHISSCIYLRRNPLSDSPAPLLSLLALPFAILLHLLIIKKSI